jgi:type IV pilus assembly protein PilV
MSTNATVRSKPPGYAGGFTLVEALVALVCLSIGLLGVAALQMTGLQSNLSSSWRSQATYLAYDILDRMRANRDNRTTYVIGTGAAPVGVTPKDVDIAAWKANLAATLPNGDGTIAVDAVKDEITVTVQWSDSRNPLDAPLVFITRSRI